MIGTLVCAIVVFAWGWCVGYTKALEASAPEWPNPHTAKNYFYGNVDFPHAWITEQAAKYRRQHNLPSAEWEKQK
jgi:hypothetical protein